MSSTASKRQVEAHPDKQISLTDPDSRSMAKAGGGSIVGYNVQVAADSKHHLIPAHEVTNVTSDRSQLSSMAEQAKEALQGEPQDETKQEQLTSSPMQATTRARRSWRARRRA